MLQVEEKRCPQNHRCPAMGICPVDAISQKGNAAPTIDEEKCIECGKCMRVCPYGVFQAV